MVFVVSGGVVVFFFLCDAALFPQKFKSLFCWCQFSCIDAMGVGLSTWERSNTKRSRVSMRISKGAKPQILLIYVVSVLFRSGRGS